MQTTETTPPSAAGTLTALNGLHNLLDAVLTTIGSAPASESPELPSISESSGTSVEPCGSKDSAPWILCIENDDDFAKILQVRVNEFGWQMLNVKEARAGGQQRFIDAPSAILLDYELPDGNGDDLLRRLRESKSTAEIPVIVVSGCHDVSVRRQMQALGATDFVGKPVNWDQLRRAIERRMPVAAT